MKTIRQVTIKNRQNYFSNDMTNFIDDEIDLSSDDSDYLDE